MYPHAPSESAEKLVVLRLVGSDPNPEGGVGETFHDNAGEFYDVLGHTERQMRKSREILQTKLGSFKPWDAKNSRVW